MHKTETFCLFSFPSMLSLPNSFLELNSVPFNEVRYERFTGVKKIATTSSSRGGQSRTDWGNWSIQLSVGKKSCPATSVLF